MLSAQTLQAIVDTLPDSLLLLDPFDPQAPWRVVACNRAACQLFGMARRELIGWTAAHIPAALAGISAPHDLLAHLGRFGIERVETTHHTAEGNIIVVESVLSPLSIGERSYVLCVDRDVTAHRNAEAELRRRAAINRCANTIARQLNECHVEALDVAIVQALTTLHTFLNTDRISILVHAPEAATLSLAYEGYSTTTEGSRVAGPLDLTQMPWLSARVLQQQLIHITDVIALPEEAMAERAALAARDVRAMLAVPISRDGAVAALLSCESVRHPRRWTSEEIGLLFQVADSIGHAMAHRQVAREFHSTEARYRVLTDHTADVISLHDAQGTFTYCSPAAYASFGYRPAELIGTHPDQLIHPDDLPDILIRGKVHDTGAITTVYRIKHKDGYDLWVESSARAVCDPQTGAIREIVAVTRDIDARKSYEAKIEQLAYYDPLTGLANRRYLYDRMHRTLNGAGRPGTATALLYLDLDRFKNVNDTLGHDAGDELLVQVTGRLREQLVAGATLARLGGDEFAVLLPDLEDHAPAVDLARRIVEQIRMPFTIRSHNIHLGVSIGIALARQNNQRPEDLLKHADIAMYQAKIEGDSYRFYEPSLNPHLQQRLRIEEDLRGAISADALVLHYQPIFDLERGEIYAVESLVRWRQPDGSLLFPEAFVPLAEETSLIHLMDRWIIRRALRQLREWDEQGWAGQISINISARTLHDGMIVDYFRACLHDEGVPAGRLIIEVTESAVMRDLTKVQEVLQQLRKLGVRVALDDFGRGYAALYYLKQLPIDILKIDRSFTQGIGHDHRDEGILRAIITIGEAVGCAVVAEGVRHTEQIAWLREAGCAYGQGFGLSRPLPAEQLIAEGCGRRLPS